MKTWVMLLAVVFTGCVTTARFTKEQACVVNSASGFKMDWYVVTANHVASEDFVVVEHFNGKEEIGVVVARDEVNDIALIKLKEPQFFDYSTATPNVRDKVFSIANPVGLPFSELEGAVQNVSRSDSNQTLVQVGIDVYYGSSGSPMYSIEGKLYGFVVKAIPGTRFTFMVPIEKVVLLIQKQKR